MTITANQQITFSLTIGVIFFILSMFQAGTTYGTDIEVNPDIQLLLFLALMVPIGPTVTYWSIEKLK